MRKSLTVPLSLLATAVLSACVTREVVTPAPTPVVVTPPPAVVAPQAAAPGTVVVQQPTALRAGFGRIEAISSLPAAPSASAGSSMAMQRLSVKMDDGSVQLVDTTAGGLAIGDRIEFTREGFLRHPAP